MYKTYFGLQREPFSIAADPRFIYMSPQHREAAQHLLYGLQSGAGFILLTGEVGSGKTMVTRTFLRMLPAEADVANVVNPRVDFRSLLLRICEDLHIDVTAETHDLIDAIHGHLLLSHAQGRRTLIVVDEAQALSHEVLELLRLLTNLDSTGRKLQIFLIGQPELRDTLRLPALEPVSQRIVARCHLSPLPEEETARYIEHRLRKAGLMGAIPFQPDAARAIHWACGGIPRRINVLCDRAMLTAKNLGIRHIDGALIERISPEVFDLRDIPAAETPMSSRQPSKAQGLPSPTAQQVAEALGHSSAATPGDSHADPATSFIHNDRVRRIAIAAAAVIGVGILVGTGRLTGLVVKRPPPPPAAAAAPASTTTPTPTPAPAPATPAGDPAATGAPAATPSAALAGTGARAAAGGTVAAGADLASAQTLLHASMPGEDAALRKLAALWGATLTRTTDTCGELARQHLRCYRAKGGPEVIRRLDRPGMLLLKQPDGSNVYALLIGLGLKTALMQGRDNQLRVPLDELAGSWSGEFATLWRAPPQFRPGLASADPALAGWLHERFAAIDGGAGPDSDAPIDKRVAQFQLTQGLQPDGILGPVTLMALNRASNVSEPELANAP